MSRGSAHNYVDFRILVAHIMLTGTYGDSRSECNPAGYPRHSHAGWLTAGGEESPINIIMIVCATRPGTPGMRGGSPGRPGGGGR